MKPSTMYQLMGLTSDMIKLYPVLRDIVEESKSYDDPSRYIRFRSACVRGGWFSKNYLSTRRTVGMKSCLKEAEFQHGKANWFVGLCAGFETHMDKKIAAQNESTNNKNCKQLEFYLPRVLEVLAEEKSEFSATLINLAKRLQDEVERTEIAVEMVEKSARAAKIEDKAENLLGQQNAMVEQIISSTLATLDKKVAHAIRMLIAKSDNKLLILQEELAKVM